MEHKRGAILSLVLAIILLIAAGIAIYIEEGQEVTEPAPDLLSGSALRQMMNESRLSPGLADGYAIEHPTYAWLFDGSFVTYLEDEG